MRKRSIKRSLVLLVAMAAATATAYGFTGEMSPAVKRSPHVIGKIKVVEKMDPGNNNGTPVPNPGNGNGTPVPNPGNGNDVPMPNPGNGNDTPVPNPQTPGDAGQTPRQEQEKADFVVKPSHKKSGMGERRSYGPIRDYMRKHPGKKVIIEFTPGKYYVKDTMFLFDGAYIRAHGAVFKAVKRGKPVFLNALFKDSGYNTKKKKHIGAYNRCKNITIDGGTYLTAGT